MDQAGLDAVCGGCNPWYRGAAVGNQYKKTKGPQMMKGISCGYCEQRDGTFGRRKKDGRNRKKSVDKEGMVC